VNLAYDILGVAARRFPADVALIGDWGQLTFEELETRVASVTAGLERLGVRPGDRVGYMMNNLPEIVVAYFAILRLGAIAVAVNVMLRPVELAYVLGDSGARVLVCEPSVAQTAVTAKAELVRQQIELIEGAGLKLTHDLLLHCCAAVVVPPGRTLRRQLGASACIQLPKETALPVVPDSRTYGVCIGVGQQKQPVEAGEVSNLFGESRHQTVFTDIPPLREVRHQQVLPDEEDNSSGALIVEPEPLAYSLGDTHATGDVPASVSLTYVMQKEAKVKGRDVFKFSEDLAESIELRVVRLD